MFLRARARRTSLAHSFAPPANTRARVGQTPISGTTWCGIASGNGVLLNPFERNRRENLNRLGVRRP